MFGDRSRIQTRCNDQQRRAAAAHRLQLTPASATALIFAHCLFCRCCCHGCVCAGDLILIERPVLSVSDDPAVCLACGVRHGGGGSVKCARFTSLFGPMRMALQAVPSIAAETDYPEARLLDVLKVRQRAEPSQPTVGPPHRIWATRAVFPSSSCHVVVVDAAALL